MRLVGIMLGVVLLSSVGSAQEVGLTARAGKMDLRLAEPVDVIVSARLSTAIDSIGPAVSDSVGMFEILSYGPGEEENTWVFELMSIDTGQVYMAPIPFQYLAAGDTVARRTYSNSLMFTAAGFEVPPNADIKDIKEPMTAPWRWDDIWPYLLVVGVIGAGWYVYRRYFTRKPGTSETRKYVPPPVPADVRALRELHDLEEKKLWQQGMTKEFYSECTEIIRRFFEGRFGFPALELTSDETLDELRRRDVSDATEMKSREFFQRADLVKFAKWQASPDVHEDELRSAYEIVRSLPERVMEADVVQEEPVAG